jgi:fatty acid amide hydrolase 2
VPDNEARRYMTTGPIARRAEDLFPFLQTVAGPDGEDGGCIAMPLGDPKSVRIADLRVLDVPDNGITPVSADLRDAQRRAAEHLSACGAEVRRVEVPALRRSLEIWSAMMAAASETSFATMLGEGSPIGVLRELARLAAGRSDHTLPALMLALAEGVPLYRGRRGAKIVELGGRLQRELDTLLGPHGVMLYPPYASVAPRHGEPLRWPFRWAYTAILNVLEMPATQVPLGLDMQGLPLGVQVAARRGADHLTLAVACELERAFGGWVPPERSGTG